MDLKSTSTFTTKELDAQQEQNQMSIKELLEMAKISNADLNSVMKTATLPEIQNFQSNLIGGQTQSYLTEQKK